MNLSKTLCWVALGAIFAPGASACSGCGGEDDPPVMEQDSGLIDMESPIDMSGGEDLGGQDMEPPSVGDMALDMVVAPDMARDMPPDEDMAPDMDAWPDEVIGRVNVTYWREDAAFQYPELHVHAVFSSELATSDVIDPVGWVAATEGIELFSFDDFWAFPMPGGVGVDAELPIELAAPPTYGHAGDFIVVGDLLVANLRSDLLETHPELYVYELSVEDAAEAAAQVALDAPLSLLIEGGDDVLGWKSDPVVTVPDAWDITRPDPDRFLSLYGQKELEIFWTPTPTPDDIILLTVETSSLAQAFQIEDNGQLDLDALLDREQLVLGDKNAVSLARVMRHQIPSPSGIIEVQTTRKVWLYTEEQAPYHITPDLFPVGQRVQAEMVWRAGDFGAMPVVDLGEGVTIENVQVVDLERQVARFDVVVDAGAKTGRRALEVDGGNGAEVALPGFVWVVDTLPSAGLCADAVDEGFVEDGAYVSSDGGLESGRFLTGSCPEGDAGGVEQVIPLKMLAGQTLHAWARHSQTPATLYVVGDCDDVNGVFACATAPRKERLARLRYTAVQDEEILLVVDNQVDGLEPSEFLVEIARTEPGALLFYPERIVAGVSSIIEIDSLVGDFDMDTSLFDFGPQVTVESAFVQDDYAEVTIRLAEGADPGPVAASASVGGQIVQVDDALRGVGYVSGPGSCMAADMLGPLGAGSYEGLTFTGGSGVVSPEPCLSSDALGQEAILRVDLEPSQTLRARVRMLNQDPVIYLMTDCNGVAQACADNSGPERSEYLEWTAPEAPTTVYLVVDGFDVPDSDVFFLELDIVP